MADREGDEGKMPLEYLYSAMQMEKYSGAASIEVVSFTLCTVPPLSLFVFYRPSLRYLFPFLSFFFLLSLLALPPLCPRFLLLLFSLFTFFDSMSAVVARIWLVITTVSLDPHHRESLSAPFVRGVSSINTCRG